MISDKKFFTLCMVAIYLVGFFLGAISTYLCGASLAFIIETSIITGTIAIVIALIT